MFAEHIIDIGLIYRIYIEYLKNNEIQKPYQGDFPGGAVVKTSRSKCRGPGFNPWSRN